MSLLGLVALFVSGCGGGSGNSNSVAPPPPATGSYGNADITGTAQGNGYDRTVIVRAKDKKTGAPINRADVSVYGQMTAPHLMSLIPRGLHSVGHGMYKGSYTFIMQGQWTVNVILRTKKGDASTAAFSIRIGG